MLWPAEPYSGNAGKLTFPSCCSIHVRFGNIRTRL